MSAPDFDDVPDTKDLVPPRPEDVPIAVLANTIAIRSLHKKIGGAERWFKGMVVTFVGGSLTVASAVLVAAQERGAEQERARSLAAEVQRNDSRITKIEERFMGGER